MSDYVITFDGGCLGNQRLGDQPSYGSFEIRQRSGTVLHSVSRKPYGPGTNNTAEYRALIDALTTLRDMLGPAAGAASVEVVGDSMLVIQQLSGRWRCRNPRLAALHAEAVTLLKSFGRVKLTQRPRAHSVAVLGH